MLSRVISWHSLSLHSIACSASPFGTFLIFVSCVDKNDSVYVDSQKTDPYRVELKISSNPPETGENVASIIVRNKKGKPRNDVAVAVQYGAPGRENVPTMSFKTIGVPYHNEFRSDLLFPVSGKWKVALRITTANTSSSVTFDIDVQ